MKKWLKVIALILSIALFIQLPVYAVEQSEIEPQTEPVASEEEETPDEEIEPAAPAEGELPSEPEPEESLPPEESESSPEPETPEERETGLPSEAPAPDEPEPEDPVTLVEGDVGGTVAENETAMPRDEEAAAEIIGEDESRREENVKHFLRSDGSYTAVQYRKPVHYRETDEDAWQDIDNTLVPDVQLPASVSEEETGSLSGEAGDDPAVSEDPIAPSAEAVWYVPASSPVDVAFA